MFKYILVLILFLTSCAIKDKAPHPSHLENTKNSDENYKVTPVEEPLSRYGNPMSYSINGKSYQVLKKSSGFKQQGIASWYGTKFHKKRTSSGEQYDMYAMTAAHKTLPLPTYLQVKNLSNDKTVIVKVNDRGPFHGQRILDLSYAAARKLGILNKGTGYVEISALTPVNATAKTQRNYYLQVGVFNQLNHAKQLEAKLQPLIKYPVNLETRDSNYIVHIGPISDLALSKKIKNQLASLGIEAFSMIQ